MPIPPHRTLVHPLRSPPYWGGLVPPLAKICIVSPALQEILFLSRYVTEDLTPDNVCDIAENLVFVKICDRGYDT